MFIEKHIPSHGNSLACLLKSISPGVELCVQQARADEMNLVGASMGVELCVCGAAEGQG